MANVPLLTGSFNPSEKDINDTIVAINAAIAAINGSEVTFTYLQGTPAIGTPSAIVLTNATGTASSLTAGHVTGATFTTALTVNTGTVTLTGNSGNTSVLTIGAGAVSVSGSNTGDQTNISGNAATATTAAACTGNSATVTGLSVAGGKTLTASNTLTLVGTDTTSINLTNAKIHTIGFGVSSSPLTTGQQGAYVVCPVSGTISGWSIMANAGTATVQTWKIAAGTASPTVSNSISTSGVSLATGTAIQSTNVTDFTSTTVTAGDMFAFNLNAVSGVTSLQFQLQITAA